MQLSRHIIVPALTVFQWTVTTVYAVLAPSVPSAIHPRDFYAVKRLIRNADYAGAASQNTDTISDSTTLPYPSTTTKTDNAFASRPTEVAKSSDPTKGGPQSTGTNNNLSSPLSSNRARSPDNLALASADIHNTDSRQGSPSVAHGSISKSRKSALGESHPILPSRMQPGTSKTPIDGSHMPRSLKKPAEWWKKRDGLVYKTVSKSHAGSDDSRISTPTRQTFPAKQFTAEHAPASQLVSKHLRKPQDSDTRDVKIHDLPESER
jgi:hypothetical protein